MKSSNPHSGVYEADTTRTLDNNGGNPSCNQGGMAVVSFDPGANRYLGATFNDVAKTLAQGTAPGFHDAVAYGIDQQGGKGGANYAEDKCPPILSDSHGTPHAVAYGLEPGAAQRLNTEGRYTEEVAPTLRENMGDNQAAVAYGVDSYNQVTSEEVINPLRAASGGDTKPMVMAEAPTHTHTHRIR